MARTGLTAMCREVLHHRIVIAIGSWLALVSAAGAGTLTYGVDAGVAETDNVTLAPSDKVSQTIAVADLDFDFKQQSARLDADAKGNFSYLDYLQGAYHNQLLGRFDGDARVALIQDLLTWTLQDDYGQAALDPFTPVTPTNIETINYLATGPDLNLRLGALSFIDLGARVARAEYETSPYTNNRISGSVAWGLQLSGRSSVSLNLDSQRVLFENTLLNTDFDRTNVFANYEIEGARTTLSADLGVTKVTESGTANNGGLAKLMLTRRVSRAANLSLTVGHLLTDATTGFSGLQGGAIGVIASAPAATTTQNYTSNYASVGWEYQRGRTTLALSARYEKDTYAGEASLDHVLKTGEFRVQRQVTRAFAAQVSGRVYQTDYGRAMVAPTDGSPNTTTVTVSGGITWRHGRGLEVKFQAEHTIYSVSSGDLGYRENRVFLTVGYRPFRAQPTFDENPSDISSPGSSATRRPIPQSP
jgi:hypothetical protein